MNAQRREETFFVFKFKFNKQFGDLWMQTGTTILLELEVNHVFV